MGKYDGLSDQERRKLYRDLSRAAREIRVGEERAPGSGESPPEQEGRGGERRQERGSRERRFRRPRYGLRLRIDSYAYAEGFAISGVRQYLGSLFAFLWPRRDPVNSRFVRDLVLDNPHRGDPSGYGLTKTLEELERNAAALLGGGPLFRRDSDRRANLRGELTRDLLNWAPEGYRLLQAVPSLARKAAEPLDHVRARFDGQRDVDVFELAATTRGVYRLAFLTEARTPVVREHLEAVGQLTKGLFRRLTAQEEAVRQVCLRIDHQVQEFSALYERLRWFARELYPVVLKLLGTFCRHEEIESILPRIYELIGLSKEERIAMSPLPGAGMLRPGAAPGAGLAQPGPAGEQAEGGGEASGELSEPGSEAEEAPEAPAPDAGVAPDASAAADAASEEEEAGELEPEEGEAGGGNGLHLAYRGILTILEYAFPGSRVEKIPEGDFSSLFWFHSKVFIRRESRSPLIARRQDFTDLLSRVSRWDPLAPVFVLYEIVRHMLESLNAEAVAQLEDPIKLQSGKTQPGKLQERFTTLRSQWNIVREELFVRYLKELDYFEREAAVREREPAAPFADTPAGRRSVETVNQIRNHVIRGYGHIATLLDRKEVFRCPPLYSLAQELYRLFEAITPERSQLTEGNPIAVRRLDREDLVTPQPGLILSQLESYIKALPEDKRVLQEPVAERNRLFLEILLGAVDLLSTLLNAEDGPLKRLGGEVVYADREDRALRQEIARDKTPLRVELRRDFEEVDQLTGLISKSGYLRFAPGLFREAREGGDAVSFLVMDLDHFKAVNDTLGHAVGDEILRAAAQATLATGREEDPAVRFGGDELIVVVRGDYEAGYRRAERIRKRFAETVQQGGLRERLERVPALMAQKELVEKKRQDSLFRGGLEELVSRWKSLPVGTLSIGVAQGLGGQLAHPCGAVEELFRRADTMLYLAKESGGNRTVVMADVIELPLAGDELREFLEFSAGENRPLTTLESYVDYRLSTGRPPSFRNYPYDRYLRPS